MAHAVSGPIPRLIEEFNTRANSVRVTVHFAGEDEEVFNNHDRQIEYEENPGANTDLLNIFADRANTQRVAVPSTNITHVRAELI